ncbi:hypothetical protein [Roseivivax sp. CAU 1761]
MLISTTSSVVTSLLQSPPPAPVEEIEDDAEEGEFPQASLSEDDEALLGVTGTGTATAPGEGTASGAVSASDAAAKTSASGALRVAAADVAKASDTDVEASRRAAIALQSEMKMSSVMSSIGGTTSVALSQLGLDPVTRTGGTKSGATPAAYGLLSTRSSLGPDARV